MIEGYINSLSRVYDYFRGGNHSEAEIDQQVSDETVLLDVENNLDPKIFSTAQVMVLGTYLNYALEILKKVTPLISESGKELKKESTGLFAFKVHGEINEEIFRCFNKAMFHHHALSQLATANDKETKDLNAAALDQISQLQESLKNGFKNLFDAQPGLKGMLISSTLIPDEASVLKISEIILKLFDKECEFLQDEIADFKALTQGWVALPESLDESQFELIEPSFEDS